ncbi:uncharacterized protein LOC136765125 isoform X2 [Amia ocellicauda]|uniref:uncharacterized protein LOC136765125 isoform X2 n=1 Tax=Amia ocellicauda TaxID=2972642 RepID=UPI0034648CC2
MKTDTTPSVLVVPRGLRTFLVNLTKAVVKEQPDEISQFISSYLIELLSLRNGTHLQPQYQKDIADSVTPEANKPSPATMPSEGLHEITHVTGTTSPAPASPSVAHQSAVFQRVQSEEFVDSPHTLLVNTSTIPSENIVVVVCKNLPEIVIFQAEVKPPMENVEQSLTSEMTPEAVVFHRVPSVQELPPSSSVLDQIPSSPLERSSDHVTCTEKVPEKLASQSEMNSETNVTITITSVGQIPCEIDETPDMETMTEMTEKGEEESPASPSEDVTSPNETTPDQEPCEAEAHVPPQASDVSADEHSELNKMPSLRTAGQDGGLEEEPEMPQTEEKQTA